MSRTKVLFLGGLTILALIVGAGCPPLHGVVGFIRLQIDVTAASKGFTVADFKVTSLDIQVRDPEDEVLKSIQWKAKQGPRSYMIPVKDPGEHEFEVIHFGECEGELVQAVEIVVFDVPARQITVIDIVPGCIAVIRIED